jgi:glycosyltransferase involved in cell wall biosynthesis
MAEDPPDAMLIASFFLDATPLLDESWTGIPVVCANMARQLLDMGCHMHFCLGERLIPVEAVMEALERNTGLLLKHELDCGVTPTMPLSLPHGRVSVGLSASVKRVRRVFDVECSVVHDMSTILQPQYHTPENVAWHAQHLMEDIASNDVTLCISQATKDDLVAYFGADPARLLLSHNGVGWPWYYPIRAAADMAQGVEPYVLVLGTREPRKNLRLVLDMLAGWPALLRRYRFVFAGKVGWLTEQEVMPPSLAGALKKGRVMQVGFVSDFEKYKLLRGAALTIFPSLFEGFGLPILESLSVGTPCVAAFSSSMPEVGGAFCQYFDPCSAEDLRRVVEGMLTKAGPRPLAAGCEAWVQRFTWPKLVARMLLALAPAIQRHWARRA